MKKKIKQSGHNKLSCWFELSYASFLTLPRVAMEAMPDEWQGKMADLLNELDDEFPKFPAFHYMVQRKEGNKFSKFPRWMINYRYPDYKEIESWRDKQCG